MIDRINTLIVALDDDHRDDDLKDLIRAISLLSGVLKVELGPPVTANDWAIEQRIRRELGDKIMDIIYPPKLKVK